MNDFYAIKCFRLYIDTCIFFKMILCWGIKGEAYVEQLHGTSGSISSSPSTNSVSKGQVAHDRDSYCITEVDIIPLRAGQTTREH